MNARLLGTVVVSAVTLASVGGCSCRRCCLAPGCPPAASRSFLLPPHPLSPCRVCPVPAPPPAGMLPPAPVPVPDARNFGPTPAPSEADWRPSGDPGVRLTFPEPSTPEPPRPGVREERGGTPPLPVGIPQFTMARPRVAAGLRPVVDGLDWLKANGYRTVVYLRQPGDDDSTDREQIDKKRGLRYVSLEVSPKTLSRTVIDEFNHVVTDPANLPLFVYDRDGALAGALWYLHFRIVDGASDEEARTKATRLGLREDREGLHREMWLAIQNYLSKQKQ